MPAPVRYAPEVEVIAANETAVQADLVDQLLKISRITYQDEGRPLRSVHAKSHGVLEGTMTVLPDLSTELAQGLFAKPGSYRVAARFSTSPGDLLPDSVSTPRGLALRVFDVPGARLSDGKEGSAQDFLLANGQAFTAPDAANFVTTLKALAATTDRATDLKVALSKVLRGAEAALESLGGESGKLKGLGGYPPTHILSESFFSQVPIRYGDYIAKIAVVPVSPGLLALAGSKLDIDEDPDALRNAVIGFFAGDGARWEVRVQLCVDLEKMPIEDASVAWDEKLSPFVPVAKIEMPAQDAWSDRLRQDIDEVMAFDPWQCIAAHRPLGSIMRARRSAYAVTSGVRLSRTGCPVP